MKKSKLIFGLASVFFMASTACTFNTSTGPVQTAEEKVEEAYNLLMYTGLTGVTSDIELITSIADLEDVAITYAVAADQNYLAVSEDGKKINVTRPTYEVGDVMLKPGFTATLSLDGVTKNKSFNVKVIANAYDDGWSVETNPQLGKTYKLGMEAAEGKVYFTGEMNGFYGASTKTGYYGADVKLEDAGDNTYYITFEVEGAKKYIDVQKSSDGAHTNFIISDEAGVKYTFNAEYNTFVTTLSDGEYYIGTYGSYTTFGPSAISYISSSYPMHLYYDNGNVQIPEPEPEPEPEPTPGEKTYVVTDTVVAGTAYKFGMESAEGVVYFTGEMNGYYGASTSNAEEAVDVKLEEATNGYYLTFEVEGAKKYIDIQLRDGETEKANFKITEEAGVVYTYNTEYKTLTTKIGEVEFYIGTYGTFTTFSVSKLSYAATSYPSHFYVEGEVKEPETTEVEEVTIAEALAAGALLDGQSKEISTKVYKVTGKVEIEGNKRYLTDGTDKIQIYAKDYTGVNSGYTLTVEGNLQNFFGTIEVVNFTIVNSIAVNYSVTLPTDANGTVTASVTTDIAYGTEVTFTVTPNTGYKVDWVKVNGSAQTLDENNQFKYTVTSNIEITVAFVDENAAEVVYSTASITLSESNRTIVEDVSKSFTENGITFTNYKEGNSNWDAESIPVKCYQGTKMEISYTKEIHKIVITCGGGKILKAEDVVPGATLTVVDNVMTLELDEPATTFAIETLARQVRVTSIEVYYVEA